MDGEADALSDIPKLEYDSAVKTMIGVLKEKWSL